MIKPLNNNCLIEVIDDYDGIIRDSKDENVQKGVLRDFKLDNYHLTASTGLAFTDKYGEGMMKYLGTMQGKTVYWQEYADSGSKFDINGKKYVLVPFYRLIGWEE